MASDPLADWSIVRRKEYVDWAVALVYSGLLGFPDWLDQQFDEARQQAEESIVKAMQK